MTRPEDTLVPLLAGAVMLQMLAGTPLRFEALFPPADAPKAPFVQTVFDAPQPAKPRTALVRDADDHFGGAS